MEPIMKEYCELVGFLGKVLGQDYEIILHDLSNMDHSVIAVANGHVSGRRIGSPMNENGLRLIRSGAWKDNPEMIRYRGSTKSWAIRPLHQSSYGTCRQPTASMPQSAWCSAIPFR